MVDSKGYKGDLWRGLGWAGKHERASKRVYPQRLRPILYTAGQHTVGGGMGWVSA